MKGCQYNDEENSDEEVFELVTDGQYSRRGDVSEISYHESSVTGMEGSTTRLLVEPDRVTLTRGSWFGGDMIFQESQKHHFLYETPFGALTMGIDTRGITKALDERGGSVAIQYVIDVDNVIISRNLFRIDVRAD
jgi:uncharacterized beta-barrel protein YwiB (DUF1934 family)